MSTPAPEIPPPAAATTTGTQIHGNTSQRLSAFFAGGALLVSLSVLALTVYWHYSAISAQRDDDHIKKLIGEQVNPIIANTKDEHINTLIGKQIEPLNENVKNLVIAVSNIKGWLHIVNMKLDKGREPDPDLQAKSSNPDKALTGITASLEQAQDRNKVLAGRILAEYKARVQTLPTSLSDYWATVAAIINYQSYVNQKENKAPDPSQIAEACPFVTKGSGGDHNLIQGPITFNACVVDLDGTQNIVQGAVFKNSVIRWGGGPVTIENATFINCRFIIDIKTEPARPDLLKQLLASDQTYFTLTAAG